MGKATKRDWMRKQRQKQNKSTLTTEQLSDEATARQYIAFGGKRGKRTISRPFESFLPTGGL